jgi:hypothetical protein
MQTFKTEDGQIMEFVRRLEQHWLVVKAEANGKTEKPMLLDGDDCLMTIIRPVEHDPESWTGGCWIVGTDAGMKVICEDSDFLHQLRADGDFESDKATAADAALIGKFIAIESCGFGGGTNIAKASELIEQLKDDLKGKEVKLIVTLFDLYCEFWDTDWKVPDFGVLRDCPMTFGDVEDLRDKINNDLIDELLGSYADYIGAAS